MMPAESHYATSAFLVTGASLLTSALLFGLWRVCKERFLLLSSAAQLVFAVHQLPLFFEASVFASWFARAGFASLFGVYLGLTALVVNLLKSPPSLAAHRFLKLYLWSIVPLSFYVFGVDDFTGYVSTVYAHHRLTINNLFALVVNLLLAAVVVRRFWLMQSQLLQARLDAGFAAERGKLTERQRIMSDIHDTVGSQLVGLLSQVRNQAPYAQLEQQTSEALQELRIAIDAIQPIDGNLAAVLAMLRHRLQPRLEAAGLQLIWHMDDLPPLAWLTPQAVQHIQRIVLEVLSNVMQHAKASQVTIATQHIAAAACIEIAIADNGMGFNEAKLATAGLGLANVRFRAAAIGASIEVSSGAAQAGRGCTVTFRLPIDAAIQP